MKPTLAEEPERIQEIVRSEVWDDRFSELLGRYYNCRNMFPWVESRQWNDPWADYCICGDDVKLRQRYERNMIKFNHLSKIKLWG